jgi:hypothetical protein
MKKWLRIVAIAVVMIVVAVAVSYARNKSLERQRSATYQISLRHYEELFKPGMSRKDIEDSLHSSDTQFRQLCCATWIKGRGFDDRSYDDLVKIGEEDPPFVCNAHNVYVAFEFEPKRHAPSEWTDAQDKLWKLSVFHYREGCL